MTKAIKKIQRSIRKEKKKQADRELGQKITLFSKLGDSCLICEKAFDKQNKKMVQDWYVIVRETQDKVNLYCPECWSRANNMINEIKGEINVQ